jgi:hypothetical protein
VVETAEGADRTVRDVAGPGPYFGIVALVEKILYAGIVAPVRGLNRGSIVTHSMRCGLHSSAALRLR